MLGILRSLSLALYQLLSQVGAQVNDPLNALAHQWNIPALSAVLFGIIGSLAPCQMSANAGAIAYLSRRAEEDHGSVWRDSAAYVLGKMVVYSLLGAAAILLGIKLPTPVMALLRRAFGPMMILFGLYLLGAFRLQFSVGDRLSAWVQRRLPGHGDAGAFFLGSAYSLSFCPTMTLLFFGLLVPLGVGVPGVGGLVLPSLFALGTALPLLLFATFLALGQGLFRTWMRGVRRWDRYIRILAGTIFLLAGVNDTIIYWFL